MESESKNGLDLIRISSAKLKNVWGKAFLATLIYLTPLLLLCLIPYAGWAISVALFGYTTLGYINYMQQLLKGENPSLKVLFVQREFAPAILIGIIIAIGAIVGLIVFILPGIVIIAYYSMSLFVLNEERIINVTDTLNVTARQMEGNKTAMFSYKIVYYLFYVLVATAAIIAELFIYNLYSSNLALGVILTILLAIVVIVLLSIITMYMYAANIKFYDETIRVVEVNYTLKSESKNNDNKVETKDAEKEIAVNNESVTDNVNTNEENTEVVAKESSEKPKKTTAKKSTSKSSTTKKENTDATTTQKESAETESTVEKAPAKKSTKSSSKKTTTDKK